MSPQYETVKPADITVGDTVFCMRSDHKVTSVSYDPSYAHPGLNIYRPAYLVQFADWKKPKIYRPDATIQRHKRAA